MSFNHEIDGDASCIAVSRVDSHPLSQLMATAPRLSPGKSQRAQRESREVEKMMAAHHKRMYRPSLEKEFAVGRDVSTVAEEVR